MASVCKPVCVCLDTLIRNRRGMRLMQDGATSHTAYTILNVLQAHIHVVKFALASQIARP